MSYSSVVLSDNPVAYWRLQETTGTTATDSSGKGYTGTYNGVTLNQAQTGVNGDVSAYFDGASGNVAIPSLPSMPKFTAEVWFYPTTTSQTGNGCILTDGFSGTGSINYVMYFDSTNTLTLNCGFFDGSAFQTVPVVLNNTSWNHIVVTYDGATVEAYLNAVSKGTVTVSDASLGANSASGFIGKNFNSGEYVTGNTQEVAIYDTNLSPSQVSAHYQAATSASSTIVTSTVPTTGEGNVTVSDTIVTPSSTSSVSATGDGTASATTNLVASSNVSVTGTGTASVTLPNHSNRFFLSANFPALFPKVVTSTVSATGESNVTVSTTGGGAIILRTVNIQGGVPGKSALNFTMWQTDSILLNVAVTDASNNPVDITGATIEWVLQYNVASVSELVKKSTTSGITITDATNGKFQIELDSADTAGNQFGAGNYYHQCRVVDVSGHGETVFIGNITMTASATTF